MIGFESTKFDGFTRSIYRLYEGVIQESAIFRMLVPEFDIVSFTISLK